MKSKSKLMLGSLFASALIAGMGISTALAQSTNMPGVDRAQDEISARIQQGVASGQISRSEAQSLQRRERDIQLRENRFKSDDYASPEEDAQLRQDLDLLRDDVERTIATPRMVPQQRDNDNTPGIDRAQQEIGARIQQGLAAGRITPSEGQALHRREREIELRENRFKSDDYASPEERQQLRQDLETLRAEVERTIAAPRAIAQQRENTPGIDNREFTIRDRVEEGVRDGRLTEREARRFYRREREIERHEARFKADGLITRQERRQLRVEMAGLRDDVERMMRNR